MPCNVHEIINYCERNRINISPQDRQDWAMFCNALKVLGYDVSTFVALSNDGAETACREKWRAERNPGRYYNTDTATKKIVALARIAGVDVTQFASGSGDRPAHLPHLPQKPQNAVTGEKTVRYVSLEIVEKLEQYTKMTSLFIYLCRKFDPADVRRVFADYRVGGTNVFLEHWPGDGYASVFPLINADGKAVDLHYMAYDDDGHRRRKDTKNMWKCQHWYMAKNKQSECRAPWPLFGEHLAAMRATAPIGIVESEKTALIASLASPAFVWCATLSISNLNPQRLSAVKDRDIYVFPDRDGIEAWEAKAKALADAGFSRVFFCGKYIQDYAEGDKEDLGDIILRYRPETYYP